MSQKSTLSETRKAFEYVPGTKFILVPGTDEVCYRHHAESFKAAADVILDACEKSPSVTDSDSLFFPAVYLYRHSFELKLKALVGYGLELKCIYDSKAIEDALGGHNLAALWKIAKVVITANWPDCDDEMMKDEDAVILEIDKADNNGQKFRYDRKKNGTPVTIGNIPPVVSLTQMRDVLGGVYDFLDRCVFGLLEKAISERPFYGYDAADKALSKALPSFTSVSNG